MNITWTNKHATLNHILLSLQDMRFKYQIASTGTPLSHSARTNALVVTFIKVIGIHNYKSVTGMNRLKTQPRGASPSIDTSIDLAGDRHAAGPHPHARGGV